MKKIQVKAVKVENKKNANLKMCTCCGCGGPGVKAEKKQ
jgi:hypothetical protein